MSSSLRGCGTTTEVNKAVGQTHVTSLLRERPLRLRHLYSYFVIDV